MNRWFLSFLWMLLILPLEGCQKTNHHDDASSSSSQAAVVESYANLVYATYHDSYLQAVELQTALKELVAHPAEATLISAKNQWKASRTPYEQTEAFRFYGGPIDGENGPEGELNAWPMDEGYVDYVRGNDHAGIINNPSVPLNETSLRNLNIRGGEENVATGYHAIEFLLWGQDFDANGPGTRPYTDYVTDGTGTAAQQGRRGQYLLLVTQILVNDLKVVLDEWDPEVPSNYRQAFLQQNHQESLRQILSGMGILSRGELSGERMTVALASHDQEDEHSCFSDTTHSDLLNSAKSIQNVYLAHYVSSDGTITNGASIGDLLDADLNTTMTNELEASISAIQKIQPPFDQEILSNEGRLRVHTGIDALRAQASTILTVAKALGIKNVQTELKDQ